jgi:hypothetical protein
MLSLEKPVTSHRADKIREAIGLGATVEEVLNLIQSW